MSDPFKRVSRGQAFEPDAELQNRIVAIIRELFRSGDYMPRVGGGPAGFGDEGAITIKVYNTTTETVPQFGVLKPGAPTILPSANENEWRRRRVYDGEAPVALSPFVIAQEPIRPETIGQAVVAGVTPVLVNITNAAHQYAAPGTSVQQLTSAASGPARLIWQESGTGEKKKAVAILTTIFDICAMLKQIAGYDATKTQGLGQVTGTCTWKDTVTC